MSILDKYARKPINEKRTKPAGTKLEPSLYDSFIDHCSKRGLTISEAIRYLIIETIQADKETKVNQGKPKVMKKEPKLPEENQEVSATIQKLPTGNLLLTDSKNMLNNVNQPARKGKGRARSMQEWTVNDRLPCVHCGKWYSLKNFSRHAKTHDYKNGYEMIRANLDKVKLMVQEKSEQ